MKRIPILYCAVNYLYGNVHEVFATSEEQARELLPHWWNEDCPDAKVMPVLTLEGYNIYQLKDIPKGSYFNYLSADHTPSTFKVTWVRDEYDRSSKKYIVYKFYDVNHSALRKGTTRVTIDVTF